MDNFSTKEDGESQWLPISDLMSVLMMVFLLIAVSYMLKVYLEKEKIEEVAITYNKLQNELYEDLSTEFDEDLKKWNAEIDKASLSVRFKSPEILFDMGSANLKPEFKTILANFFPRFITILYKDVYRNDIDEIRIEGHTSSYWRTETTEDKAYIHNMELSQNRTRNVLEYVLGNVYASSTQQISPGVTRPHKVKPNETLYSISKLYSFEIEELYRLNTGLKEKGLISGSLIYIPTGKDNKQSTNQQIIVEPIKSNKMEVSNWIRANVTSNGLSSSKLIYNEDGTQNRELSRRVEFRVKTNAEKRIAKILGE